MSYIRTIIVSILCLMTALLAAAPLPGKNIGPEVSQSGGRELKWEEGSRDYFIMHRTMLSRSAAGNSNESAGNPQADGCLTQSTYTLFANSIPDDAVVTDAFLVWTTGHKPDNPAATSNQQYTTPTDNAVTLSFANSVDGTVAQTGDVAASQAYVIGGAQTFEFESAIHEFELQGYRSGVYTYRVEITDFFNSVLAKARDAGITDDGKAYEGTYTVSGLDCYAGDPFYKTTMIISNWSIFFVYTSAKIKPKKIYVYNGLNYIQYATSTIFVSGFEFPDDPTVRVSLLVSEGDPGLFNDTDSNREGLMFRGDPSLPLTPLTNQCNPPVGNYYEVFNSVSSFYPWDATTDSQPYCIGGTGGNSATPDLATMEWAIDVDTFILTNEAYPGNLALGDSDIEFSIGANQDTVFTNLMIVSLDTKAPKFDIPESASTALMPDGREKNSCSCGDTLDRVCSDRPFYYLVKVQNWGENTAKGVTVQDSLPATIDYVAGSTEMANMFNDAGDGLNWTTIPDGEGGAFPLADPFEVAGEMLPCDKAAGTCVDTVLVRFLVQPKAGLPKNAVIENTAVLSDVSGVGYYSNSAVPFKARFASCPLKEECESPDPVKCGGNLRDGETPDEDQTKPLTTDIAIEYAEGNNSPKSDSPIIPPTSPGLTLGQFTLKGTGASSSSYYQFKRLYVGIQSDDTAILVKSIRLVYDENGNGIADTGEKQLGSPVDPTAGSAAFVLSNSDSYFAADTLHYFLILADISYNGTEVDKKSAFHASIENKDSLLIADAGTPTVSGGKIDFAAYMPEPTSGYFIFTKSSQDPPVPPIDKLNSEVTVLNIRAKALDGDNGVTSLTVTVPDEGYTLFGKGITKLRLYEDVDKDAEPHTKLGDKLLGEITSFSDPSKAVFSGLTLDIAKGTEKYLLVTCTFALNPDEKAKVVIPNAGVKLSQTKSIIELPLSSKEFVNSCDPADPNCVVVGDDGTGGCGCAIVEPEPAGHGWMSIVLIAALAAALGLFVHRRLKRTNRQ